MTAAAEVAWGLPAVVTGGVLASFALGCAAATAWGRQPGPRVEPPTTRERRGVPTVSTDDAPARDHVLLPPPTVRVGGGEVVLWTWMRHEHPHPEGLAKRVVRRFYDAAAGDAEVAAYFHGIDMPVLQAHFVRAFIRLADRGLTADDVRVLAQRHESVRDTAGRRITPEVFDKVVVALGGALHAEGVPMTTIEQIARMCLPIKTAMTSAA